MHYLRICFAVFCFSYLSSSIAKNPVYIFHDGAFDDIFALILVLLEPQIEVKHIVIEPSGETTCEKGLLSTLGVLKHLDRKDIPVSCGPAMSLSAKNHGIQTEFPTVWRNEIDLLNRTVWQKDKSNIQSMYSSIREEISLDPSLLKLYQSAISLFKKNKNIDFIANKMINEKEPAIIFELGPLVTPAYLAEFYPMAFKNISSLIFMGGSFDLDESKPGLWGKKGNIKTVFTPSHIISEDAEWNIYAAPLDAAITLNNLNKLKIPLTIVPLNVTSKVKITTEYSKKLSNLDKSTWAQKFVLEMLNQYEGQIKAGYLDFWDSVAAYIFMNQYLDTHLSHIKKISGIVAVDSNPNNSPQRFYNKYRKLHLDKFYQSNKHDFIRSLSTHQQWAKITTNEPSAIDTYGVTHYWDDVKNMPNHFQKSSSYADIVISLDKMQFSRYFINRLLDNTENLVG
jgi:inosine-uridine nucleoside N-ribohydrolase